MVPNCVPIENAHEFETYNDYPESAKNAAQRALDWADKNGWGDCGTPVGKARAAISNAIMDESTSWNLPSSRTTLKSITGKPAKGPLSITDRMPFSTPGMYSLGTEPPTTLDSNE